MSLVAITTIAERYHRAPDHPPRTLLARAPESLTDGQIPWPDGPHHSVSALRTGGGCSRFVSVAFGKNSPAMSATTDVAAIT